MAGRRRSSRGARRTPAPSTGEPAALRSVHPPFPKPSMARCIICLSLFWLDGYGAESTHVTCIRHSFMASCCCGPLIVGFCGASSIHHDIQNKHYSVSVQKRHPWCKDCLHEYQLTCRCSSLKARRALRLLVKQTGLPWVSGFLRTPKGCLVHF
jgi:hypothetical protein